MKKMLVVSGAQLLGTVKRRGWGGSQNIDYIMNAFKENGIDEINYCEMRYPGSPEYNAMEADQCYMEKEWGALHAPERQSDVWGEEPLKKQESMFLELLEYLLLDAEYDFIYIIEHNLLEYTLDVIKNITDKPIYCQEFDALPSQVVAKKIEQFKQLNGTICIEGALELILQEQGVDESKTVTINNGFDPKTFHPKEGIEKTILSNFIGNFAPQRQKELEYLFFEPSNYFVDKTFLLRGSIKPKPHPDYNISMYPNIIRDDYATHQEICNIHNSSTIAASSHFGMWLNYPGVTGQKVFEIMGAGTPSLTHDSIGMQSIIENYKTGFLVKDLKESIDAYQYCIDNPDEVKKIGQAAHKVAIENYTWSHRAKSILEFINETNPT